MSPAQRLFFIFGIFFIIMGPIILAKEYFDTKHDAALAKNGLRGQGYVNSNAIETIEHYGSPVNRQKRIVYNQIIYWTTNKGKDVHKTFMVDRKNAYPLWAHAKGMSPIDIIYLPETPEKSAQLIDQFEGDVFDADKFGALILSAVGFILCLLIFLNSEYGIK